MRQLILFLSKYRNTLLLVVLLVIAWLRHGLKNPVAEHALNRAGFGITATMQSWSKGWQYYWSLDDVNEELARENAALRAAMFSNKAPAFAQREGYHFLPARVVDHSYNKHSNYLLLKAGRLDGIDVGMGVISANGWVGTINEVSSSYASVVPLLHEKGSVGARIVGKGLGKLEWNGTDPRIAELWDIQREFEPIAGDSVYTYTRAAVAPPVYTGRILDAVQNEEDLTWRARVELSTDFMNMDWVYVCALNEPAALDCAMSID